MADLTDDDYRAIAREAERYSAHPDGVVWDTVSNRMVMSFPERPPLCADKAASCAKAFNGRAAVAEYERRAAMQAAGE